MPDSLLLALAMLAAAVPVVVAVHEAGHVLGGHLGGYYVAAAGIGAGRRLWALPLTARFNLFIGPLPLAGGATVAFPTRVPVRRRDAFFYHYGGIASQLLLQACVHLLYWWVPDARPLLLPGIALNAAVMVANVLPYEVRLGALVLASDGARALAALNDTADGAVSPQGGLGVEGFAAAEARVVTDVGRFVLGVCRVLNVDDDRSRAFLTTGRLPPPGTPPLYASIFERERAGIGADPG